jgi:GAF domain-containing protein
LEAALAIELQARCLHSIDRQSSSEATMRRAFVAYRAHGAMGKLAQLKAEFPHLRFPSDSEGAMMANEAPAPTMRVSPPKPVVPSSSSSSSASAPPASLPSSSSSSTASSSAGVVRSTAPPSCCSRPANTLTVAKVAIVASVAAALPAANEGLGRERSWSAHSSAGSHQAEQLEMVDGLGSVVARSLPPARSVSRASSSQSHHHTHTTPDPFAPPFATNNRRNGSVSMSSRTSLPYMDAGMMYGEQMTIVSNASTGQPVSATVTPSAPLPSSSASAPSASSLSLDAVSVLKATTSFALERDPQRLLRRLMRIVLETAGASRGLLITRDEQEDSWNVELESSVDIIDNEQDEEQTSTGTEICADLSVTTGEEDPAGPLSPMSPSVMDVNEVDSLLSDGSRLRMRCHAPCSATSGRRNGIGARAAKLPVPSAVEDTLPVSVFEFVAHSGETLLSADPLRDPSFRAFTGDVYFESHQPSALLLLPLLKGGGPLGVLYLEHDSNPHAFSGAHGQLLQLLCGQAALSLDNLHKDEALSEQNAQLEQVVRQRTSELELKNAQLTCAKEQAEAAMKTKADFLSNSQFGQYHCAGCTVQRKHDCR